MGSAGAESADMCTRNFKTVMEQEGIFHLLSGDNKSQMDEAIIYPCKGNTPKWAEQIKRVESCTSVILVHATKIVRDIMEVKSLKKVKRVNSVPLPSGDKKITCLLFSANWSRPCKAFIPQLVQAYNTLKDTGQELEVIFVSFDRDENGFKEHMKCMPWLVVPFDVSIQKTLGNMYKVNQIPAFIPLEVNANLLAKDAVGMINDYGADAYPFTQKRQQELKALDESKLQGGKLDELFENCSFVSGKGEKICASDLFGKTIGLYFGAHWCPPCCDFTLQLIEAYNDIISDKDQDFEVIFISTDRDHKEFDLSISKMPWLAIPYNNKTRQDLCRIFEVKWIPSLIFLGPNGNIVRTNGREMVSLYGAKGFPFTETKILQVESSLKKEGEGLPQQVMDRKHEHILKLEMAKAYICDFCKKRGAFWTFSCDVCGYDLHPTCIEETL